MESWKDPLTPLWWFSIGLLVLLVLLGAIVLIIRAYLRRVRQEINEKAETAILHQQELIKANIETQEKERERIAADLHDNLLSQLRKLQLVIHDQETAELLQTSMSTAREISHDLTPPMLDLFDIVDLITDYIQPLSTHYKFSLTHTGDEEIRLDRNQKLHLYRIFQEVMSNVIKHAKATAVDINIKRSKKMICLVVRDNGSGFDTQQRLGLGFRNIELRAKLINACYKFRNTKGTCFSILMKL